MPNPWRDPWRRPTGSGTCRSPKASWPPRRLPRGCALVFATWQTICVPMPIRLHCDFPGCGRSVKVAVSPGTGQFDLRSSGWWIVGSTAACCETHLNLALVFDPPVTQVLPEVAFAPDDVE